MFVKKIIDALTGQPRRAAESPTSVTQDIEAIRVLDHERYGSRIVLVEIPGFNHWKRTDEEILNIIREWLENTYVELDPRNPPIPVTTSAQTRETDTTIGDRVCPPNH